jgi:hypothetical protein
LLAGIAMNTIDPISRPLLFTETLKVSVPPESSDLSSTQRNQGASLSAGEVAMLSRIFGVKSHEDAPKPSSSVEDSGNAFNLITYQDRKTLVSAYQFAIDNNLDLDQVDRLAFDMAVHRMSSYSLVEANIYDANGKLVIREHPEQVAEVVDRILNSDRLKESKLDEKFIRDLLNPKLRPFFTVNVGFLELLVSNI